MHRLFTPCIKFAVPALLCMTLMFAGCGSTSQNSTQTAGNIKTFFSSYDDQSGTCWLYVYSGGVASFFSDVKDGQIGVGFTHLFDPGFWCDETNGEFERGAVQFDLTPLSGKVVTSATLQFDIIETQVGATTFTLHSCISGMMTGTTNWWTQSVTTIPPGDDQGFVFPDPTVTTFNNGPISFSGGQFKIDVALQVNKWIANSSSNEGFIFFGGDENTDVKNSNTCFSILGFFKLIVTVV